MPEFQIKKAEPNDCVIALVGNPNVGKSTLFNALTGMRQHTGNWPGKTVEIAQGRFTYKGKGYVLVDLPGTYSLSAQSEEERITVDFIRSGVANCVVIVGDGTSLERNLNLVFQVMSITKNVLLCVNLLDEAERHHIQIDLPLLERLLGISVIGTSAASGEGLTKLKETIRNLADGFLSCRPRKIDPDEAEKVIAEITSQVVRGTPDRVDDPVDRFVLGKITGPLIMMGLLLILLWITIVGANYISSWLETGFALLERWLRSLTSGLPDLLKGAMLDGVYKTVASVISVMLPPMSIFFPLFSILEDLGYLPRMSFLADYSFQRCGGCGKQALTMTMGFGCNAVGVTGCRIISSPKERLIAIITNPLVPCNGRFPTIIVLITYFFASHTISAVLILFAVLMLSICMTRIVTSFLSYTVLPGQNSHFVLELPPYRKPQIKRIVIRAFLDRTVFVLWRAILIAAPAGLVIWILQTVNIQDQQLLVFLANILEPIGRIMGMNGAILLAFILSLPANELLLPLTLTILQANETAVLTNAVLGSTLAAYGVDQKTAACMILFSLFHWPCGTTCLTIKKETGSWKWLLVSVFLPTMIGFVLCAIVSLIF